MVLGAATTLSPEPAKILSRIKVRKNLCEVPETHQYIKDWLERMESRWGEFHRKKAAYREPRFNEGDVLEGGFKPFLSNNGTSTYLVRSNGAIVDFDDLVGKYLIIFCISLPIGGASSEAAYCRALINFYPFFASRGFEMVLVVDMEDGFPDDESLFDRFFSAFPCLAIPFHDRDTRLSICSSILSHNAVLLDPNGLVMEADSTLLNFCTYGTDWLCNWFDMKMIDTQDYELRSWLDPIYSFCWRKSYEPISLCEHILFCENYLSLRRCDEVGAATVEDLSQKYVGLYICVDGLFMEELKKVHDYCLISEQPRARDSGGGHVYFRQSEIPHERPP